VDIVVDGAGNAYVSGGRWPFVAKLAAGDGTGVYKHRFSDEAEAGGRIAVDGVGNVYIAGTTERPGFGTPGAYKHDLIGSDQNAILRKMDPQGNVVYTTYLGGHGYTTVGGIAVDSDGSAVYLAGSTQAKDLSTRNGYQTSRAGACGTPLA